MLITHLVNLLIRSAILVPSRIGSNWGGLVFTLVAFAVTEAALWKWGDMKGRWTRSALIGLGVVIVAWIGLFACSTVLTIYDDHQNLAGAAARIKRDGVTQTRALADQLQATRNDLGRQLGELRTGCAVKDGINQTLQNQNRDQQTTINGCLTQAMKLLTPVEQKITPVFLDQDFETLATRKMRWLVVTNKVITPVHVVANCTQGVTYMNSADLSILGGGSTGIQMGNENGRLSSSQWELKEPGSWSPESPLLVTIKYIGQQSVVCGFNPIG